MISRRQLARTVVTLLLTVPTTIWVVRAIRPPVYVDMQRVISESVAGRSISQQYNRAAASREQGRRAAEVAASKFPEGSKEREAKEQEARRLAGQEQRDNAADAKAADENLKTRIGEVLDQRWPGRTVEPIAPLRGGENVTDAVITALDAKNVDAVGALKAANGRIAELEKKLAAPPPPARAADAGSR